MRITAASIPVLCMANLHSFSSFGRVYELLAFNLHLCSVCLLVKLSFTFRHPSCKYIVRVVATIRTSSYNSFEQYSYRNIRHVQAIVRVVTSSRSIRLRSRCSPSKMPSNIRRVCALLNMSPRGLAAALLHLYGSFIQWYGTSTSNTILNRSPAEPLKLPYEVR
jgi:hypothetical protein